MRLLVLRWLRPWAWYDLSFIIYNIIYDSTKYMFLIFIYNIIYDIEICRHKSHIHEERCDFVMVLKGQGLASTLCYIICYLEPWFY